MRGRTATCEEDAVSWPKGRSRKPQQQQQQQQPEADAEHEPAHVSEPSEPKPAAGESKTAGVTKTKGSKPQQAKGKDVPRAPWRLPKEVTLAERLRDKAKEVEWEDRSEQVYTHIDPELIENIRRQEGVELQWCTESVLGQAVPERISNYERNGWERLSPGD